MFAPFAPRSETDFKNQLHVVKQNSIWLWRWIYFLNNEKKKNKVEHFKEIQSFWRLRSNLIIVSLICIYLFRSLNPSIRLWDYNPFHIHTHTHYINFLCFIKTNIIVCGSEQRIKCNKIKVRYIKWEQISSYRFDFTYKTTDLIEFQRVYCLVYRIVHINYTQFNTYSFYCCCSPFFVHSSPVFIVVATSKFEFELQLLNFHVSHSSCLLFFLSYFLK